MGLEQLVALIGGGAGGGLVTALILTKWWLDYLREMNKEHSQAMRDKDSDHRTAMLDAGKEGSADAKEAREQYQKLLGDHFVYGRQQIASATEVSKALEGQSHALNALASEIREWRGGGGEAKL